MPAAAGVCHQDCEAEHSGIIRCPSTPLPHLHFDGHGRAIVQHRPVHLCQAGGCSCLRLKFRKQLRCGRAQLLLQGAVHLGKGPGRHLVL